MRKRASQSHIYDKHVVIEVWMCTSQASYSSNQQQEEKDDKRNARISIHVEPVLKSRRIRKTTTAKRDMAVLRQNSINFGYFFNHYSLLGYINRYGWVV